MPEPMPSKLHTTKNQKTFGPRPIEGWGEGAAIRAFVEWDDTCRNGHNTFSVTGEIRVPGRRDCEACGCLHDEIRAAFPELAEAIEFHLVSADGPMHYPANVTFFAGDRDCWGRREGEPASTKPFARFEGLPLLVPLDKKGIRTVVERVAAGEVDPNELFVVEVEHGPDKYGTNFEPKWDVVEVDAERKWYECAFDTPAEAEAMLASLCQSRVEIVKVITSWSKGKERELDLARSAAIWPDATDEDLTEPGLEQRLLDRLPALMERFRAVVEGLGFEY